MAFVFYDTETTGTDTAFDQILQFAAVRTDNNLNETDRFEIRSRLLPHIVPAPRAMLVTGFSAEQLTDGSLPSCYEMICAIRQTLLSWSPAIFIGYNSLAFDENLLRQGFYKNLHHLFLTNTNGNARTDVMRMIQAASLFAPDAFDIPKDARARSVFKLDRIAPANGFSQHRAHDAIGDVEAVIFLCRKLVAEAPDVWSCFMRFCRKPAVLDCVDSELVFSLSDHHFGRPYSWLVTRIGCNTENSGEVYAIDLGINPESLRSLSDDRLSARLSRSPKPVRRIKSNGAPVLMPAEDAPDLASAKALGLEELERRANLIRGDEEFCARLIAALESGREEREPSPYIEKQIYDGFYTDGDGVRLEKFHGAPWKSRSSFVDEFEDRRLKRLCRHLIHFERRDLCDAATCEELDLEIAHRVAGTDQNAPWLTLPKAVQQIDELISTAEASKAAFLRDHRRLLVSRLDDAVSLIG